MDSALKPLIRLKPFPMMHELHSRSYRVWASAELTASELKLNFKIEAAAPKEFSKIIFLDSSHPARMKDLWQHTCFECFIPSERSNAYVEINASPSGSWNMFAFDGYRTKANEFHLVPESQPKQLAVSKSDTAYETMWSIPTTGIREGFLSVGVNDGTFTHLGITTVLSTTVAMTYWATQHSGVKPDFHLRESFIYRL
jgi:hypothetical protein